VANGGVISLASLEDEPNVRWYASALACSCDWLAFENFGGVALPEMRRLGLIVSGWTRSVVCRELVCDDSGLHNVWCGVNICE
jgi:hypothetical protein